MKKLLLTAIFLASCGGSTPSAGQTVKDTNYVRLVVIDCAGCITVDQALTAFDRSKHFYETQLGRELILSGVDKVADPLPEKFLTISEFYKTQGRFYEVFNHLKKIGIRADAKRGEFILIYDKYLLDQGVKYTAGMAHLCGLYNADKFAVVYGAESSSTLMGTRNATTTAHEMGHWHGASHVDIHAEPNFMMSAGDYLDLLNLPPNERTLKEINQCMTRRIYIKSKECKGKNKPRKCLKNHNLRNNNLFREVFGKVQ
jgi:hypothetical protein